MLRPLPPPWRACQIQPSPPPRVSCGSIRSGVSLRIAFSALLIFQKLEQMPARLHALMQYAHNLNHTRCDRAVIEHMNRAPHPPLGSALLACRRWKLRMPGRSSSRCRVAGPSGSAATLRIAAAMSAAYRRSPADPHCLLLATRMAVRSASANRERRKLDIPYRARLLGRAAKVSR
jgi:hypothetical protein